MLTQVPTVGETWTSPVHLQLSVSLMLDQRRSVGLMLGQAQPQATFH